MNFMVHVIKDTITGKYHFPFYSPNEMAAKRTFANAVNQKDSMLHTYPQDFQLLHVGSFSDETGVLVGIQPVIIGVGTEFVQRKEGE